MYDAVSAVIPGASNPTQIERNTDAAEMPALTPDQMAVVKDVYERMIKNPVGYSGSQLIISERLSNEPPHRFI